MDKLIDLGMTKLFQLAEYVCFWVDRVLPKDDCAFVSNKTNVPSSPALQQEFTSSIQFSNEDKYVEGDLFKLNN